MLAKIYDYHEDISIDMMYDKMTRIMGYLNKYTLPTKSMKYLENTRGTLVFDILIFMFSVMDERNLQCLKL